jgi:hypothetical protein
LAKAKAPLFRFWAIYRRISNPRQSNLADPGRRSPTVLDEEGERARDRNRKVVLSALDAEKDVVRIEPEFGVERHVTTTVTGSLVLQGQALELVGVETPVISSTMFGLSAKTDVKTITPKLQVILKP